MTLAFFAPGVPSTKGSTRSFIVNGRAITTNDAGPKAKAWAAVVATCALEAMNGRAPLDGAVEVEAVFFMPRPKSHSTKRGLRPNAPAWSSSKPDADKLARCALDALTGIVFTDDARIARLTVEKRYADSISGAAFEVWALDCSAGDGATPPPPSTSGVRPAPRPRCGAAEAHAPRPRARTARTDTAHASTEAVAPAEACSGGLE